MRLSVVIPTLNDNKALEKLLTQLSRNKPEHCEFIVVDGGSPSLLNKEMQAELTFLTSPPGRARQMNAGAKHATGTHLLFLHADSIVPENFLNKIPESDTWGFCRIQLTGKHFLFKVISFCMNLRSRLTSISTGDQGLFITKNLFEKVHQFPDIPLMEDVAICKKLRKLKAPKRLPCTIQTSSRRWQQNGTAKTILLMWWLRFLFFIGVSPGKVVKKYYPAKSHERTK